MRKLFFGVLFFIFFLIFLKLFLLPWIYFYLKDGFFQFYLEHKFIIDSLLFITNIILDLAFGFITFVLIMFTFIFLHDGYKLNIFSTNNGSLAIVGFLIGIMGLSLIEFFLMQLNIPIGFSYLMYEFGLYDRSCDNYFWQGLDIWRRLFEACI